MRPTLALALVLFPLCAAGEAVRQVTVDPEIVRIQVADGNDVRFSRLTRAQGVSQTRVSKIVQDKRGFIWFATQYGLNRYDGYSFRQFKHLDDEPRSLAQSYVRTLFTDRTGGLWAATSLVFDRYDPASETFIHHHLDVPSSAQLMEKQVDTPRDIAEDRDGRFWVSTGLGLYRVDVETSRTLGFHHRAGDPTSLSSDDVKSSRFDRKGTLWVATGEGLDAFDIASGSVRMHVPIREPRELSTFEDKSGTLWVIRSSAEGLAILNRDSAVLTRYSFAAGVPVPDKLTGVSSMIEDATGQLWIGTQSDGLLKLDRKRLRATRYRNDPFNPESLAENRTTTLMRDREGTLWVGLGATEPNYFTPEAPAFRPLPFDVGNPNNLGERLVNLLYEDRKGTLWVGTTGALNRYDKATRAFTRLELPGPTANSDVLAVVEDASGALWVGTSGQGLGKLDLQSGRMKLYRHDSTDISSLSNDTVTHLLVDHTGAVWATTADGLDRYDPATDRFRTFRARSPWGSGLYVSLMEDGKHTLWISGAGGLLHFDPATESFLAFEAGFAVQGYGVLAASTGEIWAASQQGLYRFDPSANSVRHYTERDGLPSGAISCLLEDFQRNVWVSTTEGLSRYLQASGRFRNYSIQDGLPGRDFTGWSACFRNSRGLLYFGGFAGAVELDPAALRDDSFMPPTVLTQLEVGGVPVEAGPSSPLQEAIGYARDVHLSSQDTSFALEFAALAFRSPATNRYRYRLEGLDRDWHEVGSDRRIASYTTLPPGSYTFRVQGATNRGPWSEPGAAVRIQIDRPWWATWEFRALVIVLGLAIAVGIYAYRMRQLSRNLEIRFAERMGERSRIARDLHDTLLQTFHGLLLQFRAAYQLLPARPEDARRRLGTAIEGAFEAITEGRNAVQGLRSFAAETDDLAAAIKTLGEELIAQCMQTAPVEFRVEISGTPTALRPLARDEIYRIAGESLRNAFRHARATRIEVDFYYEARELRVRVRDNGKGIDAQLLEDPVAQGHFGIHGMRERANLLDGKLTVWTAPSSGTEIDLCIPGSRVYVGMASQRRWLFHKWFAPREPTQS